MGVYFDAYLSRVLFRDDIMNCKDVDPTRAKNMTCIAKCVYQSYIMGSKAIFRLMYCF